MLTRSTERVRDALIASITVKTMPEILKKLIPTEKNPTLIGLLYRNDKDKFNKVLKLSEKEKEIFSTLGSDGFDKCDTPLLYKLFRYFNFVGPPTNGWCRLNNELQNMGDVVEAIIRLRNEIVENPTQDFQNRVNKMVEIAKVVDKTLSTDDKFENAVKPTAVDEFDGEYVEKCKAALQLITIEEGNVASEDIVFKEDEKLCSDADNLSNFMHTEIKLSPALFPKAGKHSESKVKQIHELTNKLCKAGETSGKGISNESLKSIKTRKRKFTASEAAVDYPSSSTIYSRT